MSNPFRAERLDPKDSDLRRADALSETGDDEPALDPRVVQRTFNTFRDRLRMQDDEMDHLRAMIRSVHNQSGADQVGQLSGRVERLETRLPESLEAAMSGRLEKLEAKLQQAISESQSRSLETASESVSARVLPRMQSLESDIGELRATTQQIREVMQRTDTNLAKLLAEVDRLVTEVAKRPERVVLEGEDAALNTGEYPDIPTFEEPENEPGRWKVPVVILGVLGALGLGVWLLFTHVGTAGLVGSAKSTTSSTLSPIEQARVYESKKDYPKAEAIYRDLLKKDPDNGEVIRHLASVLFRQDKWDESATILKKLSGGDNTNSNQ